MKPLLLKLLLGLLLLLLLPLLLLLLLLSHGFGDHAVELRVLPWPRRSATHLTPRNYFN